MSNTLFVQDKIDYRTDSVSRFSTPGRTFQIETTSSITHATTQIVGTTHELISAGDATDACYVTIENIHTTAIVQYGYDTASVFTPIAEIHAGDPPARLGRAASLAGLYLKSSTASTPVIVTLVKIAS